ncbi:ABC transporter ATP-binding protein [Candidatus Altiarchaeota archaeon]
MMGSIRITGLGKRFMLGCERKQKALGALFQIISGIEAKKEFFSLTDISVDVREGAHVGVIGKNGSGKSTLLKLMAGIYSPTQGQVIVSGPVLFASELVAAFGSRLTVRDHIYLFGSSFRLKRSLIVQLMDEILDFAGLQEFSETRIYQLSQGMKERLALSMILTAIDHSDAKTILLDEVFRGGFDTSFREKTLERLRDLMGSEKTFIFISHNLGFIKEFCQQVVWLEDGRVKKIGGKDLVAEYSRAR